jgi:hypothetical protein
VPYYCYLRVPSILLLFATSIPFCPVSGRSLRPGDARSTSSPLFLVEERADKDMAADLRHPKFGEFKRIVRCEMRFSGAVFTSPLETIIMRASVIVA